MSEGAEVVIEPAVNGTEEIIEKEYKSVISARPAFNRVLSNSMSNLSTPAMGSGNRFVRTVHEYHSSGGGMLTGGMLSGMPGGLAQQVRDNREKEKQEMRQLNDKFANFVEKVRFLDAQNKQLTKQLEHLNKCLNKVKSSKTIYETEVRGAEEVIKKTNDERDQTEKDCDGLQKKLVELRQKFTEADTGRDEDKQKIDDLLIELSNIEAEFNLITRRIAMLEEENDYKKKENRRLGNELQNTRNSLDQQTCLSMQFKNEVTVLLEQINFTKSAHDDELKDLLAMAARDTTSENRNYFKNELTKAMREIRDEYDMINHNHRMELETTYTLQMQEIERNNTKQNAEEQFQKDEMKRYKSHVTDLRNRLAELEGRNMLLEKQVEEIGFQQEDDARCSEAEISEKDRLIRGQKEEAQRNMMEYQLMMDKQQSLKEELEIYKKLLSGDGENGTGLQQLVENYVKTTGINEVVDTETMRVIKGETSSRSSHTRSAKGNVTIEEVSIDCKSITLKNTSKTKDELLGGWKIRRKINSKKDIVFTFPEEYTLNAGETVTIIAGVSETELPNQLPFPQKKSFGEGINVQTLLFNKDGEERASQIQREVVSSVQETE